MLQRVAGERRGKDGAMARQRTPLAERLDIVAFGLGLLAAPLIFVYSVGGVIGLAALLCGAVAFALAPGDEHRGPALGGALLGLVAVLATGIYLIAHGRVFPG